MGDPRIRAADWLKERQCDTVWGFHINVRLFAMASAAISLPYLHAHFALVYPCKDVLMEITTKLRSEEAHIHAVTCTAEDFIRSPWSLGFGPLVMCLSFMCERLFRWACGDWAGKMMNYVYYLERIATPQIWRLEYHPSPWIYAMVSQAYLLLMLEMVCLGIWLRSGATMVVG